MEKEKEVKIFYWPDGIWCLQEELSEMVFHGRRVYKSLIVEHGSTEEDIEDLVMEALENHQ